MGTDSSQVAAYYDYTLPFYEHFWHGDTDALHYGFADATTRTFRDELLNTNRFLADAAAITDADRVLDAGCGIGGSATWLATHRRASVLGITLSDRQLARARRSAASRRLEGRVRFELRNVLDTGFDDESFDVVWALESACYLGHSLAFAREAHRLLRPGGRVVVGDGFLRREPVTADERRWYREFNEGLVLPGLTRFDEFPRTLSEAGFSGIRTYDTTSAVLPSAERMLRRCTVGHRVAQLTEAVGLTPSLLTKNNLAGIAQYHLIEAGIAMYGVVSARK